MPIIVKNTENENFAPIEAGTYDARCYSMIYLGTIKRVTMGKEEIQKRIRISWELPGEMKEFKKGEGLKPHVISKEYTLSLNEKANLRKILASWRGKDFTPEELKGFDITKVLGVGCTLTITHQPKEGGGNYAAVTAVSPVMKGHVLPALINPKIELSYENFDFTVFNSLPDFVKEKIKSSEEYQNMMAHLGETMKHENAESPVIPPDFNDEEPDDLPF